MSFDDRTNYVIAEMHRRAVRGAYAARQIATDMAKEKAPVDFGNLKKAIHGTKPEYSDGAVRFMLVDPIEYAQAQEFGRGTARKFNLKTGKWNFTPHMRPTVDYMQTVFKGIMEKGILGE